MFITGSCCLTVIVASIGTLFALWTTNKKRREFAATHKLPRARTIRANGGKTILLEEGLKSIFGEGREATMAYEQFAEREAGRVSAQIKEIMCAAYSGEISVAEAKKRIAPLYRRYTFYRVVTGRRTHRVSKRAA